MRKLFLLYTFYSRVSLLKVIGLCLFSVCKDYSGEQYNVILNEKWKELHQMRIDEGTITIGTHGGESALHLSQTGTTIVTVGNIQIA